MENSGCFTGRRISVPVIPENRKVRVMIPVSRKTDFIIIIGEEAMKKAWIPGIVIAAMVVGIGGMLFFERGKEPAGEYETERVVLPVLIGGGDASWENCMNEVALCYMKEHPDVEVDIRNIVSVETIDYAKGLVIEEALGNFKGIVEMRNVELYAGHGKLAPLPDSLTGLMKKMKDIDGKVYSLPRYYSCRGIIYNKKIFEQLELEVPESYQEFLELCRTLKGRGICPLTIGAADLWHLDIWGNGLYENDVKSLYPNWISLRNEGRVHWTDEIPMKMLADFKYLFEKGYVEDNYAMTTDAETIEMLTEEKAAMLYSGTWLFSQILKADPQFEIGWFFLPNDVTEAFIGLHGDWEWAVTDSTREDKKMYDAAVDFLGFYYSHDIYQRVLQNMNGFSSLKEDIPYQAIPIQSAIMQQVKEKGEFAGASIGTEDTPEGFGNIMYQNMLDLANGMQSVEKTAENLDREWEKRLETN